MLKGIKPESHATNQYIVIVPQMATAVCIIYKKRNVINNV